MLRSESRKADRVKSSFHAAALVHKRRVLAVGHNRRKSHPLQAKFGRENQIYLHAEVDVIVKTINLHGVEILKDCSLYVLRTTGGGRIASSRPCESCWRHIKHFEINEVWWS